MGFRWANRMLGGCRRFCEMTSRSCQVVMRCAALPSLGCAAIVAHAQSPTPCLRSKHARYDRFGVIARTSCCESIALPSSLHCSGCRFQVSDKDADPTIQISCERLVENVHLRCCQLVGSKLWAGEWDGSITIRDPHTADEASIERVLHAAIKCAGFAFSGRKNPGVHARQCGGAPR